jgi:hypothetical protein
MGEYMIVQDMEDPYEYYILLHLSWDSWNEFGITAGSKISPGKSVAKVGCADGGVGGYHLHVSVVRSTGYKMSNGEYYDSDSFLKSEKVIYTKSFTFPIWGYPDVWVDPFDHSIQGWGGRK